MGEWYEYGPTLHVVAVSSVNGYLVGASPM
jgi:hypothetical protein